LTNFSHFGLEKPFWMRCTRHQRASHWRNITGRPWILIPIWPNGESVAALPGRDRPRDYETLAPGSGRPRFGPSGSKPLGL